uniref:DUF6531 domain-containing protein n=1 Tax=Candidatus Albibeggiatoa sp. nov. BB20 TaxID=3162723 RepID=UPI0033659073
MMLKALLGQPVCANKGFSRMNKRYNIQSIMLLLLYFMGASASFAATYSDVSMDQELYYRTEAGAWASVKVNDVAIGETVQIRLKWYKPNGAIAIEDYPHTYKRTVSYLPDHTTFEEGIAIRDRNAGILLGEWRVEAEAYIDDDWESIGEKVFLIRHIQNEELQSYKAVVSEDVMDSEKNSLKSAYQNETPFINKPPFSYIAENKNEYLLSSTKFLIFSGIFNYYYEPVSVQASLYYHYSQDTIIPLLSAPISISSEDIIFQEGQQIFTGVNFRHDFNQVLDLPGDWRLEVKANTSEGEFVEEVKFKVVDDIPPTIEIMFPQGDLTTEADGIQLSYKAVDNNYFGFKEIVFDLVNSEGQNSISLDANHLTLQNDLEKMQVYIEQATIMPLELGSNTISIKAVDEAGNESEIQSIIVTKVKPPKDDENGDDDDNNDDGDEEDDELDDKGAGQGGGGCGKPSVADPIDVAIGAQFLRESLLQVNGTLPLNFTVDYNSLLMKQGQFGHSWGDTHYGAHLEVEQDQAIVHWTSTRYNYFNAVGNGKYQSDHFSCNFDILEQEGDGWKLTRKKGQVYRFNAQGQLIQRGNKQGQFVDLIYNDQDQLVKVTEPS